MTEPALMLLVGKPSDQPISHAGTELSLAEGKLALSSNPPTVNTNRLTRTTRAWPD